MVALVATGHRLAAQPESNPSTVQVLSNTVSVRRWGNEQGLPQSSVTRLAVDRDGYVWGATFGGLIRFDGQTIVSRSARELPILTGNAVTALIARPDGELWIGTPAGTIGRLRDGRLVDTLPHPPLPAGSAVTDLRVDRSGTLWLNSGEAVFWYAEGRWGTTPLPFGVVSPFAQDADGHVVFHGQDGVVRATRGGGIVVAPAVSPTRGGIHVDRRGRIWVGGADGLYQLEGGRPRRVPGVPGPVFAITSDAAGDLWLGVEHVLYRYMPAEPGSVATAAVAAVDARADITAMVPTADGALVVGTLNGLLVVRRASVTVIESPTGTQRREAGSLVGDGDGRVWLTADCGAVFLLDRGGAVLESIARPVSSECARSLVRDARGRLWVGGDGAVQRFGREGTNRRWEIPAGPGVTKSMRPLLFVGDTLLFGISDGRIGRIGPDDVASVPAPWNVATDRPIESMAREGDGTLWVGQTGRLSRWVGTRLEHYGGEVGIPNSVPRAMLAHRTGGVWIGTYGSGLLYFRPGARARQVPLPDQTVSALLDDGNGRLWMPGNRGLTVVPLASLERWLIDSSEVPAARLLSSSAGVPEGNFGVPAATVIAPQLLGFASVAGLVLVQTGTVSDQSETPRVHIDAVRTPRRTLTLEAGPLEILPDDRQLQVEFSAPSFRLTEEIQFRYRLDGRDRQWIALGSSRDFRLVGLRPGRFVLRVEARVPDGGWRAAVPLTLEVQPLFVERVWWRVALGLLLLLAVTQYFRQRLRVVQAEAKARELALRARQAAAEQQEQHQRELAQVSRVAVAGELTASLSHELGQPLAAIVNNAEVARRLVARSAAGAGDADPRIAEALEDVVAQGHRASDVVRAFRRFLRREHGEREVLVVRDLLHSVTLLLGREYADAAVSLTLAVDPAVPPVHGERVLLQQVFVNLLQNALQAVQPGATGQVLVRARPSGGGVRISVVDNGPGIAAEVRPRLFEPFVTSRSGGLGMGLPIARRVVDGHGGHMGVGRLPGCGAVVSVWIPAAHPALTSHEGVSSLNQHPSRPSLSTHG